MKHLVVALLCIGCTRPAEQRALAELEIGAAAFSGAAVEVAGGLAAIRAFTDHRLELWSQSPVLDILLVLDDTNDGTWTIVVRNSLPDAVLVANGTVHTRMPGDRPTVATFVVPLAAGAHGLHVAPPDADRVEPFRVAAMADIQTALPSVDDVFELISAVPDARFVVSMGDITQRAELAEYELFDRQLETLAIPFYTTLGNHELWADHMRFFDRYGRASFHFDFKGAAFTFADSGDAGIDPLVEDWLDDWIEQGRAQTHLFLTHFPPVDPVGTRYGAMRSSRDGRRLLSRLVDGEIDLTLYGHIHTLIEYENAGIPAYVSGGGGANPSEKLDGIDRHFLVLDIAPAVAPSGVLPDPGTPGSIAVDVHRVD